jgi:hypothetical protein
MVYGGIIQLIDYPMGYGVPDFAGGRIGRPYGFLARGCPLGLNAWMTKRLLRRA